MPGQNSLFCLIGPADHPEDVGREGFCSQCAPLCPDPEAGKQISRSVCWLVNSLIVFKVGTWDYLRNVYFCFSYVRLAQSLCAEDQLRLVASVKSEQFCREFFRKICLTWIVFPIINWHLDLHCLRKNSFCHSLKKVYAFCRFDILLFRPRGMRGWNQVRAVGQQLPMSRDLHLCDFAHTHVQGTVSCDSHSTQPKCNKPQLGYQWKPHTKTRLGSRRGGVLM